MASGCAVLVSNIGALPEVVKTGGLFSENTQKDFYEAIKRLIETKSLRSKYQRKGRKRSKELTWEICAKKYLKVYDRALSDK